MSFIDSLGRNPIRSRKSFKDRPSSVYSGKSSSSSGEEAPPLSTILDRQESKMADYYLDEDGNIQSEENNRFDSCGNIPATAASINEESFYNSNKVDHSFA